MKGEGKWVEVNGLERERRMEKGERKSVGTKRGMIRVRKGRKEKEKYE